MKGLRELGDRAEVRVVAVALVAHQRPQRVVEVVGPGGVAAVSATLARAHHPRVVEPRLGDHVGVGLARVHPSRDLRDDVLGAGVEDRVDRVEPQPIEPDLADPVLGRLADPFANRIAPSVVEVDRLAPRGLVGVGEVRTERRQRRDPRGADMVVDDVEDHREAAGVGRRDQPGESLGAAVGGLRGAQVDAVVAPAAGARELGDRHQLDRGHAELREPVELPDRGLEGALGAERADVQLVDQQLLGGWDREAVVRRGQRPGVEQPRRSAQPLGLPAAARVGQSPAVDHERVVIARVGRDGRLADAVARVRQRITTIADRQLDCARVRGPDAELRAFGVDHARTEWPFPGMDCGCGHRRATGTAGMNWSVADPFIPTASREPGAAARHSISTRARVIQVLRIHVWAG